MYILQKRAVVGRAVLFLALLCATLAENCFAQVDASSAEIGPVTAQREGEGVKVTIGLNGAVPRPRIERLVQPDRIALDFVGATPKSGFQRIRVGMPSLTMIRTSLYRTDDKGRPITRIVLDLPGRCEFKTSQSATEFALRLPDGCVASPATAPKPNADTNVTQSKSVPLHDAASVPSEPNTLKAISYSDTQGRTDVVLSFQTSAQPRTMKLENPRRLVLDFPRAVFGQDLRNPFSRKPDIPYINLIRSSLFQADPPTIRVVLEETNDAPRPKVSVVGTKVEIQYFGSSTTAATSRQHSPQIDLPPQAASATQKTSVIPSQVEHSPHPAQGIFAPNPTITYNNGLLSIDAENAPLADVLYAIGEKTGAGIQLPMSDGMLDRVALKMGPVTPRQLLTTLLEGSRYTYFIVEDGSGGLQKVILTPKQ
jgi:hypothetical protein